MKHLNNWTVNALTDLPCYIKDILDTVARINLYKMSKKRKYFRNNDYGFEQVLVTYLAERFIQNLPDNFELGVGEALTGTASSSKKQADFSLVKDDGTVKEVMEVKTITDNNFSWLNEDVSKLRGFKNMKNKFLLSINLYLSKSAYTQMDSRLSEFTGKHKLTIQNQELIYKSKYKNGDFQLVYYYYLFEI